MSELEHKFRKLFCWVTYFLPEYYPIHEEAGSAPMFLLIKDRMEQLMKGKDAAVIDRLEFESHLVKNEALSETYLEIFSLAAIFYRCRFEYEGMQMEYFIMYDKRIRLIYFRKFEAPEGERKN
ncbi:MAG TPA: hypothetical protein PLU53_02675 [Bacteroidia bacterium]|nr:hypothetical protein [Bacteroidia bacterium]